jgi:hypothetical protein
VAAALDGLELGQDLASAASCGSVPITSARNSGLSSSANMAPTTCSSSGAMRIEIRPHPLWLEPVWQNRLL